MSEKQRKYWGRTVTGKLEVIKEVVKEKEVKTK
jgi:hypothetical protein